MFAITGEVLGLKYRKHDKVAAWHADVVAYDILDAEDDTHLATFYMDLFRVKASSATPPPSTWFRHTPHPRVTHSRSRRSCATSPNPPQTDRRCCGTTR